MSLPYCIKNNLQVEETTGLIVPTICNPSISLHFHLKTYSLYAKAQTLPFPTAIQTQANHIPKNELKSIKKNTHTSGKKNPRFQPHNQPFHSFFQCQKSNNQTTRKINQCWKIKNNNNSKTQTNIKITRRGFTDLGKQIITWPLKGKTEERAVEVRTRYR